jgi:hypothetical protein
MPQTEGRRTTNMREFETLSAREWSGIAGQRQNQSLSIKKENAGLSTFHRATQSRVNPGYVEYPPTDAALTNKGAAELIVGLSHDLKGDWNRFTILVYRAGGRIFFKELNPTTFEALVEF